VLDTQLGRHQNNHPERDHGPDIAFHDVIVAGGRALYHRLGGGMLKTWLSGIEATVELLSSKKM
jgi:hypothetical protein